MTPDANRRDFLGSAAVLGLGVGALALPACDPGGGPRNAAGNGGDSTWRVGAIDPSEFGGSPTDQLEAAMATASPGDVIVLSEDYELDRTWVISGVSGVTIAGAGGRIFSDLEVAIDVVDCDNVVFRDLSMIGGDTLDNLALQFRGSNLWCAVFRCDVDGFGRGVHITGNTQHEVYVERSRFTTQDIPGSRGIVLESAVDHALIGNVIRGFERGVQIQAGTNHRLIANHIYRFPTDPDGFHHCVAMENTYGHLLSQNVFDNASVAGVWTWACWGLSITGNKFQALDYNANAPMLHMDGPGSHKMWNIAVIGNIFHQHGPKNDDVVTYGGLDLAGSRNHIVRDNQFLNARPVATSLTIYGTMSAGKTSKNVSLSSSWRKLLGPVGACQVSSSGPEHSYLSSVGSSSVTVRMKETPTGNRRLSLAVSSRLEEVT